MRERSDMSWERNEGGMPRLFSGWRLAHARGLAADGQPHAYVRPDEGKTLFETIEQSDLPDEQTYVLYRGPNVYVVLNVYPYTSGHVMAIPNVGVASLHDLADVRAAQQHVPGRGPVQAGHDPQAGRLSAPRLPDNTQRFPFIEIETHTVDSAKQLLTSE